jgi:hypothetical protein
MENRTNAVFRPALLPTVAKGLAYRGSNPCKCISCNPLNEVVYPESEIFSDLIPICGLDSA